MPVYEGLGDVRERAVTMGKIADSLTEQGQTKKARDLLHEVLPVFENLGDVAQKGKTLWFLARLAQKQGSEAQAFEYLKASYGLLKQVGWLDRMCRVGLDLGKMLAARCENGEARELFLASRDGFLKLGRRDLADEADAQLKRIGSESEQTSLC